MFAAVHPSVVDHHRPRYVVTIPSAAANVAPPLPSEGGGSAVT